MPVWGLNTPLALQPCRGVGQLWTRLSDLDPFPSCHASKRSQRSMQPRTPKPPGVPR